MNPKRAEWEKAYRKAKEAAPALQQCPVCEQWGHKSQLSPHHTRGRRGENIMTFVWVHEIPCHRFIHDNPKIATERGWLIPNR